MSDSEPVTIANTKIYRIQKIRRNTNQYRTFMENALKNISKGFRPISQMIATRKLQINI